MRILLLAMLFTGCTQKYQTYHAIKKSSFKFDENHNPVTPLMLQGRAESQESCEGQIFWNRNAKKITDANIPSLVKFSCPGSEYLLNAKITETWWTTIVYSRSCVKVESFCPKK